MELLKGIELKKEEKVLNEIKHHPIVIIPHIFVSLFILILDFFLMYFLFLQGWWGVALFGAVIFVVLIYFFRMIFLYNRNKFIITNLRIIDVEQPGFFESYTNELPLHKIKGMEVKKKGVFEAIFGYGTLKITVFGDVAPLELYRIAKPAKFQVLLNQMIDNKEEEIKEARIKDDPLNLILAETNLLSMEQKEELIERIGQQIDKESGL